jgi:Predicted membrane protein
LLELVGGTGGLGWVAVKAVLMFAVAVIGLRLGERRTLAQLGAFDFAVAVAIGAIIGRTVTAPSASFARRGRACHPPGRAPPCGVRPAA